MKKNYSSIIFFTLIIFILNSCSCNKIKRNPNKVYMPDMYYSNAYEPYSDPDFSYEKNKNKIKLSIFKNGTSSLNPVEGTVPKTDIYESFSQEISKKGLEYAKKIKKSPLKITEYFNEKKIIQEGKKLYDINCSICHGDNGEGDGFLVKNEKILGVPNYKDRDLTIGSIYYTITYGKNNMGSYSSQLKKEDIWKISEYVLFLKNKKK